MTEGYACALVGAQYGSEGKGTIAYALADEFDIHVRTGAPNAGHTIRHEGQTWKMRSIPCGWVNPDAMLVIGPGALVDKELLIREMADIERAGYPIRDRLFVDSKAQLLLHAYHEYEGGVTGHAHLSIGSTGEGVGPARMAKIARGTVPVEPFCHYTAALDDDEMCHRFHVMDNTADILHDRMRHGQKVLLEGTQGQGLSLTHGSWPYVTSTDTGAAQLCADAGVAPMQLRRVILVARTYPIRVAGNSGPLRGETSWSAIGQKPEKTTVTLKTRRVGKWDPGLVQRAVRLNGATEIALTFLDYVCPAMADADELDACALDWIGMVEKQTGIPVTMCGVGGPDFKVLRPVPIFSKAVS